MGDGLSTIDQHAGSIPFGHFGHLFDRQDGAKAIGGLGERDEARLGIQEASVFLHHDLALIVDGDDANDGASLLGNHLPWDDIGVMFEHGNEDLVTGLQEFVAEGVSDEVDGFGGTADEDNFLAGGSAEEVANFIAGLFVGIGGSGGEGMGGAMDIRIVLRVVAADGIDDGLGFLGRGGIVEPDQGLPVDQLMENGEIGADGLDIEGAGPFASEGAIAEAAVEEGEAGGGGFRELGGIRSAREWRVGWGHGRGQRHSDRHPGWEGGRVRAGKPGWNRGHAARYGGSVR